MFKTMVYLTEEQNKGVKSISLQKGISQSEVIRKAIDGFLGNQKGNDWKDALRNMKGIWVKK